ncbi:MAG: dicarboxylate/amino acid:cation symporter [Cryomorphaceae bacterium]|nr:dicarboxylate/amino acid:cation symporter [Cryomorphaceae bacterium]
MTKKSNPGVKFKLALHWRILLGLLAGTVYAFLSAVFGWSQFTIDWIAPFGTIFINLLKLIAVPLVLFSIIAGIAGLGSPEQLGRLGAKTLVAYLSTTLIAVTMGLLLVNAIKPGNLVDKEARLDNRMAYEIWAKSEGINLLDDDCLSCKPKHQDRFNRIKSRSTESLPDETIEGKKEKVDNRPLSFLIDMVPDNIFLALSDNKLMLQIIFFGLFFGISLLFIPSEGGKPVINLVESINLVFLKMVDLVMRASPFLVFALMAGVIADMAGDDISKIGGIFEGLLYYAITVIVGLALLGFGLYPLIVKFFAKGIGFMDFMRKISPAQLLAFSTSSSAATLPVTLDCVENRVGVNRKISSFVLPIGATVNMDGTSVYQAIAVVFLAQLHMVDLSIQQQMIIVLTATLASIGSAAVPSAGIIMLIIVMEAVKLNPAWIAIILPIDRILDMCRTVVNVTGDATVTTIIAQSEGMLEPVEEA